MKKLSKVIKYELKRHFSDANALTTLFVPIYAVINTQIANMSNAVSINSQLYYAGLTYAGLASLTKLRDFSKRLLGITDKTREVIKYVHDILLSLALGCALKPTVYLLSGETDWEKIAVGTGVGLGLSALISGPALHFVDIYRDLTGVKESKRTPMFLRRRSKKVKKTIAAGLLAASIGITGLYYSARSKLSQDSPQSRQNIEQIVEAHSEN